MVDEESTYLSHPPATSNQPPPALPARLELSARLDAAGNIIAVSPDVAFLVGTATTLIEGTHISDWLDPATSSDFLHYFPMRSFPKPCWQHTPLVAVSGERVLVQWWVSAIVPPQGGFQIRLEGFTEPFPSTDTPLSTDISSGMSPPVTFARVDGSTMLVENPDLLPGIHRILDEAFPCSFAYQDRASGRWHMTPGGYDLLGVSDATSADIETGITGIEDFIHPEDVAEIRRLMLTPADYNTVIPLSMRLVTPDGTVRHVRQHLMSLDPAAHPDIATLSITEDVTDEVIHHRSIELLLSVLSAVSRATNEHALLTGVVNQCVDVGGFRYSAVYDLAEPGDRLSQPVTAAGDARWLTGDITSLLHNLHHSWQPTDQNCCAATADSDYSPSQHLIPIPVYGNLRYVLAVWSDGPSAFDHARQRLFTELSASIEWALGKLASQYPVAMSTQHLAELIANPETDFEMLLAAARHHLATIEVAGQSRYWKTYADYSTKDLHPHAGTNTGGDVGDHSYSADDRDR